MLKAFKPLHKIKMTQKLSYIIQYFLYITSFMFLLYAYLNTKPDALIISTVLFFAGNIVYGLSSFYKRILFTIFQLTIFLFLLGRPFIGLLEGTHWWENTNEVLMKTLMLIYISLVFLRVGASFAEYILNKNKLKYKQPTPYKIYFNDDFIKHFQNFMFIVYFICLACEAIRDIDKLQFMQTHDYYDFYIVYKNDLPMFIRALANMHTYALCIFLATLPSKKKAFIPLASFVAFTIPELIIGIRNPIMLNVIFVILYYILRDYLNKQNSVKEKRWIGKLEKTAIYAGTPALLILMSLWNYIRDNISVAGMGLVKSIRDLLYLQGVSFNTISAGIYEQGRLPSTNLSYVFGPFIEYFKRGSFGRVVFGTKELLGNTVEMALYGNSFANSISYIVRSDFLEGHGMGSSFIIEAYVDFGLLGVIIISLFIGAALIYMAESFKKGWLARTLILVALTAVFFAPRAEATSWLIYLVNIQFWALIISGCIIAGLLSKRYINSKQHKSGGF